MSKKPISDNIFDFAAHQPKPVAKKKPEPSAKPPIRSIPIDVPTDTEVEKMLEKMEVLKNDLQQKLEKVFSKSSFDSDAMEKYLDAISDEEQSDREKKHQALENQIWDALGADAKTVFSEKKQKKAKKVRKGKSSGARRKWIPTR